MAQIIEGILRINFKMHAPEPFACTAWGVKISRVFIETWNTSTMENREIKDSCCLKPTKGWGLKVLKLKHVYVSWGDVVKVQILTREVWGGAQDAVFLPNAQVMVLWKVPDPT